jgi:hypothetical protein
VRKKEKKNERKNKLSNLPFLEMLKKNQPALPGPSSFYTIESDQGMRKLALDHGS